MLPQRAISKSWKLRNSHIPNFGNSKILKFRIPTNGCFDPTVVHNFQRRLLKQELNTAQNTLAKHYNNVHERRSLLQQKLSPNIISSDLQLRHSYPLKINYFQDFVFTGFLKPPDCTNLVWIFFLIMVLNNLLKID